MPKAWIPVTLTLSALSGAIFWAMFRGDFATEGRQILDLPWGKVTLLDLYAGLGLASGWIVTRERSRSRAALWVAGLLALGNPVLCIYVLVTLRASRGDAARFWLGHRARRVDSC
jgi:hypothetical protein